MVLGRLGGGVSHQILSWIVVARAFVLSQYEDSIGLKTHVMLV